MGESTPNVPAGGLQCVQRRELLESKLEFASAGDVWRASGSGRSARHAVRVAVRVLSFVVGLSSGRGEPVPRLFFSGNTHRNECSGVRQQLSAVTIRGGRSSTT